MKSILKFVLFTTILCSGCYAGPIPFEPFSGKLSTQNFTPKYSPETYLAFGKEYLRQQQYRKALICFGIITHHFPEDQLATEALFLSGVSYFQNNQPDLADKMLSAYMQKPDADYSETLFLMKYSIAKSFAEGKRKHLFALEGFPSLLNADEDALRICDEIVSAFPNQDLGAQALYLKGDLLEKRKELAEAIKTFKKLTLQFSNHALSPQAFVRLSQIYLMQAKKEPHCVQYLNLAKVNEEAIKKQHPNHPLNNVVAANVRAMCDCYASGLYSTGRFYEKKKKPSAARIYYSTAIQNYPESSLATKCHKRLDRISKHLA